jgi:hypothetical protein
VRGRASTIVALAGALLTSTPAVGSHSNGSIWAGKWLTATGTLRLSVIPPAQLAAYKGSANAGVLFNRLPCKAGPQLYAGTYGTAQGDQGIVVACGTSSALNARFLSNGKFSGAAGSFRIAISTRDPLAFDGTYTEDSGGSGPYTGRWERHIRGDSGETRVGTHPYTGPFEVKALFYGFNQTTAPPSDSGQCPRGRPGSITSGQIIGRRTEAGDVQGGGNVTDTPHRSRCRVPHINVTISDLDLSVIVPGRTLRAVLHVRISPQAGASVHRRGDCLTGTEGRIVMLYDIANKGTNGYRADRLEIGPWESPCTAHDHVITNAVNAIPARGAKSTWVIAEIQCPSPSNGARSPKFCT